MAMCCVRFTGLNRVFQEFLCGRRIAVRTVGESDGIFLHASS